jgi:NCS1 family nucleobase:cation symporter-1
LAAGCATYVLLLDPLTYRSSAWYPHLTASLPAAAAAALVYFLAGTLVMWSGRGGYRRGGHRNLRRADNERQNAT